jgi:nitroreductase
VSSELERPTVDHLLSTTRAVRKRLDLSRPVPPEVIEECLRLAIQAPTGSNRQGWQWVVVTDADERAALADMYRDGWGPYINRARAGSEGLSRVG